MMLTFKVSDNAHSEPTTQMEKGIQRASSSAPAVAPTYVHVSTADMAVVRVAPSARRWCALPAPVNESDSEGTTQMEKGIQRDWWQRRMRRLERAESVPSRKQAGVVAYDETDSMPLHITNQSKLHMAPHSK
jgi:hypothetical protein